MNKYRVSTNYLMAETLIISADSFAEAEAKVKKTLESVMKADPHVEIQIIKKVLENKGGDYV